MPEATVATAPVKTLRRPPSQRRAHDRVERILDAADRLLAEGGASALGTKPVAAAAGVSIGSLYHWFPNKESIVEALALRHWQELAGQIEDVAGEVERGTLDDPLAAVIDVLAAGFRARPGLLAMWFSELRTEHLRDATRPTRTQVAAAVTRILATSYPGGDPELLGTVAGMVTLLGDGIVREAFRLDRAGDPRILAEGSRAIRAYVDTRLGGGV